MVLLSISKNKRGKSRLFKKEVRELLSFWLISTAKIESHIPFLLEAAAVLAAFVHPNHIVYLCPWGFTLLPPTCNSK
ncbi:hypothetical protein DLR69_15955 [Vibrio paracholerae]|uniref:Uncharacterized protein n=1 Tax=Vibrio paracholerae TaxID=650003 RepID=A0ABX9FE47_9VIBR|nr:hypothetical protein DLR69_15955 [Vibrio paracholerae]